MLGLVAAAATAAYLAIQRAEITSWDGMSMASVGRNLWLHGSLKECCYGFASFPKDPGPYAKFGIGSSLMFAPLWGFQLHHGAAGLGSVGAVWLGLANPLLLAATTVVVAKTGLVLGWRRSSAVLAALAFALLTMAPFYSSEFFAEPGVTLGVALLALGFAMWPERLRRGASLVGLGTAIAILFRPDSIFLVLPVVICIAFVRDRRALITSWRTWIGPLVTPIALVVAWTLYYNWLRYHDVFQFGYNGYYDRRGFSTPLTRGVAILLWSPGMSFFVYAPILIAALPGVVWLARRRAPLTVVILTLCVLRIGFYARWWTPQGGNAWGPRFLLPMCALLALALGETFEHIHDLRAAARRAAISAVTLLAALSALVQVAAFSVQNATYYYDLRDTRGIEPSAQLRVIHQRSEHALWRFGDSRIAWNLRHAGSDNWWPLYWFRHGPTPFGLGMFAIAALAGMTAIALAMRSDARTRAAS